MWSHCMQWRRDASNSMTISFEIACVSCTKLTFGGDFRSRLCSLSKLIDWLIDWQIQVYWFETDRPKRPERRWTARANEHMVDAHGVSVNSFKETFYNILNIFVIVAYICLDLTLTCAIPQSWRSLLDGINSSAKNSRAYCLTLQLDFDHGKCIFVSCDVWLFLRLYLEPRFRPVSV
jgi:hypothetical protein